ncbi:hypothetical protein TWF569_009194 [Orbilia oligospora]|uniref:Uncharacterized protein n=1 Tax=Orbilia oligospora TaxID=2813651 RepID=A0A7C8J4T1_ORBOL|nr:hypothetical protein TWF706_001079 [Orbilia oligospora]KAF3085694.1 hypothetical protein TWF102_011321 [Orbilia oligospora]KAF3100812.1 hypothetical protein TWF103_008121 [Orbilia oligospora]KAF3127148.1 hypothetical protein TWF594_000746 [Orbilia oligospora]KAF3137494.1 hypothetical protein TWF569_009194 [Orbilia oligospora]
MGIKREEQNNGDGGKRVEDIFSLFSISTHVPAARVSFLHPYNASIWRRWVGITRASGGLPSSLIFLPSRFALFPQKMDLEVVDAPSFAPIGRRDGIMEVWAHRRHG